MEGISIKHEELFFKSPRERNLTNSSPNTEKPRTFFLSSPGSVISETDITNISSVASTDLDGLDEAEISYHQAEIQRKINEISERQIRLQSSKKRESKCDHARKLSSVSSMLLKYAKNLSEGLVLTDIEAFKNSVIGLVNAVNKMIIADEKHHSASPCHHELGRRAYPIPNMLLSQFYITLYQSTK